MEKTPKTTPKPSQERAKKKTYQGKAEAFQQTDEFQQETFWQSETFQNLIYAMALPKKISHERIATKDTKTRKKYQHVHHPTNILRQILSVRHNKECFSFIQHL